MNDQPDSICYIFDNYLLYNKYLNNINLIHIRYLIELEPIEDDWNSNWEWFVLHKTMCPNLNQTTQELMGVQPIATDCDYIKWHNPIKVEEK